MIKTIGAVLVIGTSTLAGFFFAQRFGNRCQLLSLWLRILDIFQTEIYYETRLLPDVFRRTAALVEDRFFSNAFIWLASSLEYGSDRDFGEDWKRFLTETGLGILSNSDYTILHEMGTYLGCTDRMDQLEKIKTCKARLELNLQLAEGERKKRVGLYRYLGFALGTVIVLWLL